MNLRFDLPFYYWLYKKVGTGRARYYGLRAFKLLRRRYLLVKLDVNWCCNLKCISCYFSEKRNTSADTKAMSPELFDKIARDIFPRTRVLYLGCGAEPLLSPHIKDYMNIAGRYRIPVVALLTNGTLLREDIISSALSNRFNQVEISIDAAHKSTYESIRIGGRFERLLENLETLKRAREKNRSHPMDVRFNFTAMRRNISELGDLVDLAARYNVSSIRIRQLMDWGGIVDHAAEKLSRQEYLQMIAQVKQKATECGVLLLYEGMYDKDPLCAKERLHNYSCIDPFYKIMVKGDGKMRCCGFSHFDQGDFKEQTYDEMVKGPVLSEVRRLLREAPEESCLRRCKGMPSDL
ncbi:MAG: radical SAM/SPASM domain-containing protein [Thermodesulfovibrionales bacterium]